MRFEIVVAGVGALLLGAGLCASWTGSRADTVSWLALAFVVYGALFVVAPPRVDRLWFVLSIAAVAGVAMVAAPSLLSDDVYRYAWDARVFAHGYSPYAYAPDAQQLADLRDDAWYQVNHKSIPTIYPPLAQLYFRLASALGGGVVPLKSLGLLVHLWTAGFVHRLVGTRSEFGIAPGTAAALVALNPLALSASALGGHVDAAVGLAVVAGAAALAAGSVLAAALGVVAAAGLKLLGLVLWPLLWVRSRGLAAAALLASIACLVPLLDSGHAGAPRASGVSHYAQRWRGNEGPFLIIEAAARGIVARLADGRRAEGIGPDEIVVGWLEPVWDRVAGGSADPNRVFARERKEPRPPAVFDRAHLAGLAARAVALGLVLIVSIVLASVRAHPAHAVRVVVLAAVLLSPQIHPWYLLWLLPLEVALGRHAVLIWSAAALVAYAPLDLWYADRVWAESLPGRALEYAVVGVALIAESVVSYVGCASARTATSS